jgi:hypothetical protein
MPSPSSPRSFQGVEAFAHGLGMAIEFLGNDPRAQPVPTARDHPGMQDPIGRGMEAAGEAAHLSFFMVIPGWASSKQFGHGVPPGTRLPA